jgi:hypothetical protein
MLVARSSADELRTRDHYAPSRREQQQVEQRQRGE